MSDETKHAPLPWRCDPRNPVYIEDANQNDVAGTGLTNVTAPDEANAAFIVRWDFNLDADCVAEAQHYARVAIAKAKGDD